MEKVLTFIIIVFGLLTLTIQLIFGNFPLEVTAFPLNVTIMLLWAASLYVAQTEKPTHIITKTLGSGKCSVTLIALFLLFCLILGLVPQTDEIVNNASFIEQLGLHQFTTTWMFVGVVFLLMTNLWLVVVRKYATKKKNRWRFLLNHVGLWLVLLSTFWGVSDTQKVRLMAIKDQPTREAFDKSGHTSIISVPITYKKFSANFFDNGMPESYRAEVLIGNQAVTLEVNKPYSLSWDEDVYLTSYDTQGMMEGMMQTDSQKKGDVRYCILEVVKQPWRYVTLLGILMMAIGAIMMFLFGRNHKSIAKERKL